MSLFNFKKKTAQELMIAGNYKAAVKAFQDGMKKTGFDPGPAMQMGNCMLKLGLKKEAKKTFLKVGSFYGDQGFFNKAVAAFKKALAIDPDDQAILEKLADYHGKVPSYMIDTTILERAKSGVFQPNLNEAAAIAAAAQAPVVEDQTHQPEPAPVPQEPAPIEQTEEDLPEADLIDEPVAQPATTIDPAGQTFEEISDLDFQTFSDPGQDIAPEIPEATGSTPEGSMLDDFDSFQGLEDLDEELTAEFALDDQQAPTPDTPEQPVISEEDNSQATVTKRTSGNMVFSSRIDDDGGDEGNSGLFESLDDALDSLFDATPAASALNMGGQHDTVDDARHWPLFRTMPKEVFLDFVMALETRDFNPGDFIVKQGEDGQEMFLITDGHVDVLIQQVAEPVAHLKEGDFFGEAGLLTRTPRNASCRAQNFTSCLVLTRAHLMELSQAHPSVMESIRTIYYTRLEENAARKQ